MSNVVTIKADDSNMRETTDIVDKLNKLFDGTSLVAEIVTKETTSKLKRVIEWKLMICIV